MRPHRRPRGSRDSRTIRVVPGCAPPRQACSGTSAAFPRWTRGPRRKGRSGAAGACPQHMYCAPAHAARPAQATTKRPRGRPPGNAAGEGHALIDGTRQAGRPECMVPARQPGSRQGGRHASKCPSGGLGQARAWSSTSLRARSGAAAQVTNGVSSHAAPGRARRGQHAQ